jgi:YVTN family beta-propeller protein
MIGFKHTVAVAGAVAAAATLGTFTCRAEPAGPAPLQLEATIALGQVRGRIDHLAIDLARNRLFVAQLGDNTVGIVDLKARKVIHTIRGLSEPQGVAYLGQRDTLVVANAGDGSARLHSGSDYKELRRINLGDDADNIRVDKTGARLFIGSGTGRLAEIDPGNGAKILDMPLPAHPEGFQVDPSTSRIFVNLPGAKQIAVLDSAAGRQSATWPLADGGNFPMALDQENRRVIVVFRSPASLAAHAMSDGARIARVPTCGDADDVFVDPRRDAVYVSCGDGMVDVFRRRDDTYERLARIPTRPGARTSLFVPELDRLFVAARATSGQQASILVFKPDPAMLKPAPAN